LNLRGRPEQQQLAARQVRLLAGLLYFGLTTGAGVQTLGEEYVDVAAVAGPHGLPPSRWRRGALVALQTLPPFVWEHFRCEGAQTLPPFVWEHFRCEGAPAGTSSSPRAAPSPRLNTPSPRCWNPAGPAAASTASRVRVRVRVRVRAEWRRRHSALTAAAAVRVCWLPPAPPPASSPPARAR
jgi:hypothetical protein